MDLFFNELSIKENDHISNDSVIAIVGIYKELLKYRITTCRISSVDNNRLFEMISQKPESINFKNFYFSFFRSPYESEAVERNQDDYYRYCWTYKGEECIGFALAFLLNSACLSIFSPDWNFPLMELQRDEDFCQVRNICVKEHVALHIPQIQENVEILKCDIPFKDKKIVLRKDHGMDVLEEFSKRLLRSPYLIGIVNSLPYNPYERRFIKRVRENGLIEIVLPWTDQGYGMVIKTTGRTVMETTKIAEILEEEFGYI